MRGSPSNVSSIAKSHSVGDLIGSGLQRSDRLGQSSKTGLSGRKGTLLNQKSSLRASLNKTLKTTTPSAATPKKGILKRKPHDHLEGCSHERRIVFNDVQIDDGDQWNFNGNITLSKDEGLDVTDMLSLGVIDETQCELIQQYKGYCPYFRPGYFHKTAEGKKNSESPSPASVRKINIEKNVVDLNNSIAERSFFDDYIMHRVPAKLKGPVNGAMWHMMPDDEDNVMKWSNLDYLRRATQDCEVMVERASEPGGEKKKDKKKSSESSTNSNNKDSKKYWFGHGRREPMRFTQFLDCIESESGPDLYLSAQPTEDGLFPSSLIYAPLSHMPTTDYPKRPRIIGPLIPHRYNLWIGKGNKTTTGLHVDFHDNIYRLISGKKTFRLYSPAMMSLIGLRGEITKMHENGLPQFAGHDIIRSDGASVIAAKVWKMTETIKTRLVLMTYSDGTMTRPFRIPTKWIHPSVLWQDDEEELADELHNIMSNGNQKSAVYPDHFAMKNTLDRKIDTSTFTNQDWIQSLNAYGVTGRLLRLIRRDMWHEVTLEAGDSLYLPSGWAHEVISSTDDQGSPHVALNYWFHPPSSVGSIHQTNAGKRSLRDGLLNAIAKASYPMQDDEEMTEEDVDDSTDDGDNNGLEEDVDMESFVRNNGGRGSDCMSPFGDDGTSTEEEEEEEGGEDGGFNRTHPFGLNKGDEDEDDEISSEEDNYISNSVFDMDEDEYDEMNTGNNDSEMIDAITAEKILNAYKEEPKGLYVDGYWASIYSRLKKRAHQHYNL